MSDAKEKSNDLMVPNFFYRKRECYGCDLKRHKLFLRESPNYMELFCKDCLKKIRLE